VAVGVYYPPGILRAKGRNTRNDLIFFTAKRADNILLKKVIIVITTRRNFNVVFDDVINLRERKTNDPVI